jgi:hypothetical protein
MAIHVYTSIIFADKGLCTLVKFVSENVSDIAEVFTFLTCLGHLDQCDKNGNDPISVTPPKVAKASSVSLIVAGIITQKLC